MKTYLIPQSSVRTNKICLVIVVSVKIGVTIQAVGRNFMCMLWVLRVVCCITHGTYHLLNDDTCFICEKTEKELQSQGEEWRSCKQQGETIFYSRYFLAIIPTARFARFRC